MSGDGRATPLQLVNVTLTPEALVAEQLTTLTSRLAAELPPPAGRRLLFLPPLTANLAALPPQAAGRDLVRSVWRAAAERPGRGLIVRLAYPKATWRRLPWLIMHDRVHAQLRGPIGELAVATGSTVVAGTALLDHPRTHWEGWPDRGNLFHAIWTLGPDGEPGEVLRQPYVRWPPLRRVPVDKAPIPGPMRLSVPGGPAVAVSWDRDEPAPAGPIAWAPRLVTPRVESTRDAPGLLATGAEIAVQTCLAGRLGRLRLAPASFIATRAKGRAVRLLRCPEPADGMAWQVVDVDVDVDGADSAARQL